MRTRISTAILVATAAGFLGVATAASATTYTFTDGTNATGYYNDATGVVALTALIANPTDVAQTISGILLNFSGAPNSPSLTQQLSGTGDMIPFSGTGNNITTTGPTSGVPTNWLLSTSGNSITLSTNNSCGGTPCDLIIGPGESSNPTTGYTNANSSIKTHSPFIWEQGLFTVSGLTGLILDSVQFQYGTVPALSGFITPTCGPNGAGCAPPPPSTPLPGTLPLFIGGAGLLSWLGIRRKKAIA